MANKSTNSASEKIANNKQQEASKVTNLHSKEGKRTEIKDIGKIALINKLFNGSDYTNPLSLKFHPEKENRTMTFSTMLLQGIDFNLIYTPLKHLGYKSALAAMGPVYANCYTPKGLFFNIGLSSKFCYEDIAEFWTGVISACKGHDITQLGLDINASLTGMSISITAYGEQPESFSNKTLYPSKNSLICITGNLGAAYMGLHVLERERVAFEKLPASLSASYKQPDLSKYKYILSQYLSPSIEPKIIEQFKDVEIYPSAGRFITKGLAYTVKELCAEYDMGVKIFLDKIPIAAQTFEMADELGIDAITAALNGGDDYKFLFVIPLDKHEVLHKEFPSYDIIGHLCDKSLGEYLITPDGTALNLKAQGW